MPGENPLIAAKIPSRAATVLFFPMAKQPKKPGGIFFHPQTTPYSWICDKIHTKIGCFWHFVCTWS
jgi:hypothetical protein